MRSRTGTLYIMRVVRKQTNRLHEMLHCHIILIFIYIMLVSTRQVNTAEVIISVIQYIIIIMLMLCV